MQQKSLILRILLFQGLFLVFFSISGIAYAKTVYVNSDGDDEDNGTADQPFKTLEAAAEEINEGEADDIKLGKGSFDGGVIFDQGVSINGAGKGSTTITGPLTFKKKAALKNVSIRTKARNAVTIGKSSVATIKNVDIREYMGIGIWIMSGGGVLTLEDSRIGGASGKGIYAEPGTKLNLIGNIITNNKQEGVDIRQNTRGTIKNNTITDNGESGIEIIVGSSDFVISGNDIKNNGASGIAHQFYELNKKFGTITTTGNTLTGNDKYGLDCNKPQSGNTPVGYWADSITLEGNTLGNNKRGDTSATCKFIEAKTEEEEKKAQEEIAAEEKTAPKAEEEVKIEALVVERARQENQFADVLMEKIETLIQEEKYNQLMTRVESKSKKEVFLDGWKSPALDELQEKIHQDSEMFQLYQAHLEGLGVYEGRTDLEGRVRSQEEKISQYQSKANIYSAQKGLKEYGDPSKAFKYIVRIFYALPL